MAATFLMVAPIVAAVVWSANRSRLEREHELAEQSSTIAVAAAAHLDQYLAGIDGMAAAIVRHPAVMALAPAPTDALFASLLDERPLLINLVLVDAAGTLRGTGTPIEAGVDIRSWPWVTQVPRTGRPFVGALAYARPSGRPTVVLGYPVHSSEGVVAGALGIAINLGQLQTVFSQISLPAGSVITLADSEGRVLARTHDAERFIGTRLEESSDAASAPRTAMVIGPDGVERISATHTVARGPWLVSVGIPRSVVRDRVIALWTRNLIIVGVSSAVLLALGVLVAWQTTLHLTRLRSAARRIADGDLSPPDRIPAPNLEFAELQDAFVQMASNLRDTRDALDRQVEQERKMNDTLQSLQRQVVRQERLAAVGVLVSGVAHELNNPLQAILGTAELLERNHTLSPAAIEEIAFLKTQSGRAREIIRNLSRFSSQQTGPPEGVDLREVVAEVIQLRRRDLENCGVDLQQELTSNRKVQANFTELEQVTLNFVINAQQALESVEKGRGRILIRLLDDGRKVRLEVHDNGPGVQVEDEPKLFQPFFTTKPVGKGTGLGLSVSYGIIESYGGSIGHKSNPWGGATFFFELPATDSAGPPHDRPAVLQRSL